MSTEITERRHNQCHEKLQKLWEENTKREKKSIKMLKNSSVLITLKTLRRKLHYENETTTAKDKK